MPESDNELYYDVYRHLPEWSPDADIKGTICDAKQAEQIRILQHTWSESSQVLVRRGWCRRRGLSPLARDPSDRWQISISPAADKIAVVQSDLLAIFLTQVSNAEPIFATSLTAFACSVHPSIFFTTRAVAWDPSSHLLAVLDGHCILVIDSNKKQVMDRLDVKESNSSKCQQVVGMSFCNVRALHLFVLKMDGTLCSFDLNNEPLEQLIKSDGIRRRADRQNSHADKTSRISLVEPGARHCTYLAMALHENGNLSVAFADRSLQVSISLWRTLDEAPFVECVTRVGTSVLSIRQRMWNRILSCRRGVQDFTYFDVECKLQWSPGGKNLALVTPDGELEVWNCDPPILSRSINSGFDQPILDIAWWNNYTLSYVIGESVFFGSLNLVEPGMTTLGQETFSGRPLIARFVHRKRAGLFALESEVQYLKRFSEGGDSIYAKRFIRLFSVWELTPYECLIREVRASNHQQALALAHAHNLDAEIVYKHMWQLCDVHSASFLQCASDIKDTAWLLQACIEKLDDNLTTAGILIELGLSRTANLASDSDTVPLIAFRLKFLMYKDRLSTLSAFINQAQDSSLNLSAIWFLRCSLVEVAEQSAKRGDVDLLNLLFNYHSQEVRPSWLSVASLLPCTTPPNSYKKILPARNLKHKTWRPEDWAEGLAKSTGVDFFQASDLDFDPDELTQWYLNRARQTDAETGQLNYALELLALGTEKGVAGLSALTGLIKQLCLIAYEQEQWDMSLVEYENLDEFARVCALLCQSSAETIVEDLREKSDFLQTWSSNSIRKTIKLVSGEEPHEVRRRSLLQSLVGDDDHPLHRYLVYIARERIEIATAVIKHGRETGERLFSSVEALIRVSLACVYACDLSAPWVWRCMSDIFESLPQSEFLNERVLGFVQQLEAAEIMSRYGIHRPLHFFLSVPTNANLACDQYWCLEDVPVTLESRQDAERTIQAISRNAGYAEQLRIQDEWTQLKDDILRLRNAVFPFVSERFCEMSICESLLLAERFDLVKPLTGLSAANAIPMVIATVRTLFNSAPTAYHPFLERAKECLLLLPSNPVYNRAVQVELNLIEALQSFANLGMEILPFKLRQQSDRLEFIEQLIAKNPPEFANDSNKIDHLNELSTFLGHSTTLEQLAVKMMLVRAALEQGDSKWAHRACFSIMENKFKGAAALAEKVAESSNISQAQQQLFAHCLWASDLDELDRVLQKWKFTVVGASPPSVVQIPDVQIRNCSLAEEVIEEWLNESSDAPECLELPALVEHNAAHLDQTMQDVAISFISQPTIALSYLYSLANSTVPESRITLTPTQTRQFNEISYQFHQSLAFAQSAIESPKHDWYVFLAFATAFPWSTRLSSSSVASYFANLSKSKSHSSDIGAQINSASSFLRLVSEAKSVESAICWNNELDMDRFQSDETYRDQHFRKLAETISPEHLSSALAMCSRYNISVWDVYTWHVRWALFKTPPVEPYEPFVITLLGEPERFLSFIIETIIPAADGENLPVLLRCFQLLQLCFNKINALNVGASLHIQILEDLIKDKVVVNFKRLIDIATSSNEIELRVNKNNIMLFLRLSKRLCQILTNLPILGGNSGQRAPLPSPSLISSFSLKATLIKCRPEHIPLWFTNNNALLTRLSRQHFCSLFLNFLEEHMNLWSLQQCCEVLNRAIALLPSHKIPAPSAISATTDISPAPSPSTSSDTSYSDQLVEARVCVGVLLRLETLLPSSALKIEPISGGLAVLRKALQDMCSSDGHEPKGLQCTAEELAIHMQVTRDEIFAASSRLSSTRGENWTLENFLSDCVDRALLSAALDFSCSKKQKPYLHQLSNLLTNYVTALPSSQQSSIVNGKVVQIFQQPASTLYSIQAQIAILRLCHIVWMPIFPWMEYDYFNCLSNLQLACVDVELKENLPSLTLERKDDRLGSFKSLVSHLSEETFVLALKELRVWADLLALKSSLQCPLALWECCSLLVARALVLTSNQQEIVSNTLAAEDRLIAVQVILQTESLADFLAHPLLILFVYSISTAVARNLVFRVAVQHAMRAQHSSSCIVCTAVAGRTGPDLSSLIHTLIERRYYAHALSLLSSALGLSAQLSGSPSLLRQYLVRARVHPVLQSSVSQALSLLEQNEKAVAEK